MERGKCSSKTEDLDQVGQFRPNIGPNQDLTNTECKFLFRYINFCQKTLLCSENMKALNQKLKI